jgi:hypothetical protein
MKIYSPHFYNVRPLAVYLAGESMLEKPKRSQPISKTPPAYVVSIISSISK